MSSLAGERQRRNALFASHARCIACGERDSIVLNADAGMILCGDCDAIRRGQAPFEEHHLAGRRYCSSTIRIPINMHRRLTARQRAWIDRLKRVPAAIAREIAILRGFGDLLHDRADTIEEHHVKPQSEMEAP